MTNTTETETKGTTMDNAELTPHEKWQIKREAKMVKRNASASSLSKGQPKHYVPKVLPDDPNAWYYKED